MEYIEQIVVLEKVFYWNKKSFQKSCPSQVQDKAQDVGFKSQLHYQLSWALMI